MKSNWAHLKTNKFTENCKQKRNSINENDKQTQITFEQPNIYVSSGQNSTSTKKSDKKWIINFVGIKRADRRLSMKWKGQFLKWIYQKRDWKVLHLVLMNFRANASIHSCKLIKLCKRMFDFGSVNFIGTFCTDVR